jgi:phage terminase large subunit-like protein
MDKAKVTPSAQNTIKTKHLDIWVNADVAWMDMFKWKVCEDASLTIEDCKKFLCVGALDLASKTDVAVAARLFFTGNELYRHYYFFPTFYLPEAAIRESSNSQYAGWVSAGYLKVTSGTVIDFDEIEREVKAWPSQCELISVAYDPFQATQFSNHMLEEGLPMVEVGATVKNLSDPMKEFDALVRDKRFHHQGNPVMEWMVSNVVAHYDHKDNVFPNKLKPDNKIDGAVAAIMALNRAMLTTAPSDSCGITAV